VVVLSFRAPLFERLKARRTVLRFSNRVGGPTYAEGLCTNRVVRLDKELQCSQDSLVYVENKFDCVAGLELVL